MTGKLSSLHILTAINLDNFNNIFKILEFVYIVCFSKCLVNHKMAGCLIFFKNVYRLLCFVL